MIPTQYARILAASAICLSLCVPGICADAPNHVNIDGIFDPIAFTANNQSTLPNYKLTRNKLANPSFEQGLNGWSSLSFSPIPRQQWDRDFLFVDQSTRVHGRQSLRVLAWNGPGVMLKALMSQTQPGQTYTLSFYAKSEVNGHRITTLIQSDSWGKWQANQGVSLTQDWQRYSLSFTARSPVATLLIGQMWSGNRHFDPAGVNGRETCYFWLDGLMLERATSPGPYVSRDLEIAMSSPKVFEKGQKKVLAFTVSNVSARAYKADVRLTLHDFFRNTLGMFTFPGLALPPGGQVSLSQPLEDDALYDYIGLYGLRFDLTDRTHQYNDYLHVRMAVIEPLYAKNVKHSKLFAFGGANPTHHHEIHARLMNQLGFGMFWVNKPHDARWLYDVYTNEDILRPGFLGGLDDNRWYKKQIHDNQNLTEIDAALEQELRQRCARYFQTHDHFSYYKFINEPEWYKAPLINNPNTHKQFIRILHEELKKAVPDAIRITSDPSGCSPAKCSWLDTMLASGAREYFDILAIHTYQKTPENPSLANRLEAVIALADRWQFPEIWLTEGHFYISDQVPAMGYYQYKHPTTFSNVNAMPVSLDLHGYKAAVAMNVRTILTVLKYADRIRANVTWHGSQGIDVMEGIPRETGMAYHALARYLGNATFIREFSFSDSSRCYLFDDGNGGAVAALWDYDEALAMLQREPYTFALPHDDIRVTDLMGRELAQQQQADVTRFELGYMPVLIHGRSLETTAAALSKGTVLLSRQTGIKAEVRVRTPTSGEILVTNNLRQQISGTLQYRVNGEPDTIAYAIPPLERQAFPLSFPQPLATKSSANEAVLSYELLESGELLAEDTLELAIIGCARRTNAIVLDGKLHDWQAYKPYRFKPEYRIEYEPAAWQDRADHAARSWMCWDDEALYLAYEVQDDHHTRNPINKKAYKKDSLQLFFDTFGDARTNNLNMDDDYAYTIAGEDVIRQFVPQWQSCFLKAGIETNIPVVMRHAAGTTVYELKIPRRYLEPMPFEANQVFGFGTIINDSDQSQKRESALTSSFGKEAWNQPTVLPKAVLMPAAGVGSARPLSLAVDLTRSQPLQQDCFGTNVQLTQTPIWFDAPDLAQKYREAGKPFFRFPGGTGANFYHPETGFMDEDTPTRHDYKAANARTRDMRGGHGKTPDAFFAFAEQTGARYSLVLNIACRTLEQNRAWLQTLAADNREIPAIEIGNELYFAQYAWAFKSAKDYVDRARQTTAMIREIFPEAKVGVVIPSQIYTMEVFLEGSQDHLPGRQQQWMSLLEQETFYDAVIIHLYSNTGMKHNVKREELLPFSEAYANAIGYAERHLNTALNLLERSFPGKEIWVTEYGMGGFSNAALRQYRLRHSHLGCLHSDLMLLRFLTRPSVTMTHWHSFTQSIRFAPQRPGILDTPTPQFRHLSLFGEAVRNSQQVIPIEVGPDGQHLEAAAFVGDRTCYVIILNKRGESRMVDGLAVAGTTLRPTQVTQLSPKGQLAAALEDETALQQTQIQPTDTGTVLLPGYSITRLAYQWPAATASPHPKAGNEP